MARKRYGVPSAKPGEVIARYGREYPGAAPDLVFAWGGGGASKTDGRIVMRALSDLEVHDGRSLVDELERRGYDISTLRFSIRRKVDIQKEDANQEEDTGE